MIDEQPDPTKPQHRLDEERERLDSAANWLILYLVGIMGCILLLAYSFT